MIVNFNNIGKLQKTLKNKKVVLSGGCFDLLHEGHINFLNDAKQYGEVLVVAVQSDRYMKLRKGKSRPVFSARKRAFILHSLKSVDHVVLIPSFLAETKLPMDIIRSLQPTMFVSRRTAWKMFKREFNDLGVKLKIIDGKKVNSSSELIQKIIKKGRLSK